MIKNNIIDFLKLDRNDGIIDTSRYLKEWNKFKYKIPIKYRTYANAVTFCQIKSMGIDVEVLFMEKINKLLVNKK